MLKQENTTNLRTDLFSNTDVSCNAASLPADKLLLENYTYTKNNMHTGQKHLICRRILFVSILTHISCGVVKNINKNIFCEKIFVIQFFQTEGKLIVKNKNLHF